MDNHRLILFIALSVILFLLFESWQTHMYPPQATSAPEKQVSVIPQDDTPSVTPNTGSSGDIPSGENPVAPVQNNSGAGEAIASSVDSKLAPETPKPPVKSNVSTRVKVDTDLLHVELDSKGADIKKVTLNKYPIKLEEPNNPLVLFSDELPNYMVSQSGFKGDTDADTVGYWADFSVDNESYALKDGEDKVTVNFTWKGDNGREIRKVYTFYRNKYLIDLHYEIRNGSAQAWRGSHFRQIKRSEPDTSGQSRFTTYAYTGGVVSRPDDPYEKIKFEDMRTWVADKPADQGGWVAMIQHYFLGAIIPAPNDFNKFYTQVSNSNGREFYIVGLLSQAVDIAPGSQASFDSKFFIGPKEQSRLEAANTNLRLTVDYTFFTVIARPLYWILDKLHDWFGNWGLAIILVTLLVKAVFYKLSEKSYKSMARMRKFQPKLQALKERYGDDKQRFSQAMMDLYRKEKVNPLGGCLPMLVQIPVFISLYWVLMESVELRQAPFIFWIHDLSVKDPYFVLPLLMGISMYVQQKLNPAPMDPVQQKVMQLLPVIFTVFMAWFPAGLVLYWVVNNILGILQQWYITRKIEAA